MIDIKSFLILSSSCKSVKGATRSIIVDYLRGQAYFITNDYYDLLQVLDRNIIEKVMADIDGDSIEYFVEFVSFLLKHELAYQTQSLEQYPTLSDEFDDPTIIQDAIIEIDKSCYDEASFERLCKDLKFVRCKDIQLRLLSDFETDFVEGIINLINHTSCNFLELHCTYSESFDFNELWQLVERQSLLANVFVYGCPEVKKIEVVNVVPKHFPIGLGTIYCIDYDFQNGNCCGIINFENLIFDNIDTHRRLKKVNGCLDKKITVNRFGDIKNCPSMKIAYGNIRNNSIMEILENHDFRKYWNINKDQISICKVCEFRYNCTDCRAFLQDADNLYSKPLKCGYDPYSRKWESEQNYSFSL